MIHHSNKITHFKELFCFDDIILHKNLKEGGVVDSYLVPTHTMYGKTPFETLS